MAKQPLSNDGMLESHEDFEGVYEVNQPLIYKFIFWRVQDHDVAQDLTSHVFEKAWRTRHNFRGGSAKAWLFRIARTTMADYWRAPKEIADDTAAAQLVSDQAELGEAFDRQLRAVQLQKAVRKLPRQMRQVIELRFVAGLSAREAGAKLGLSESNVRVLQYRALKKMRGYLQ